MSTSPIVTPHEQRARKHNDNTRLARALDWCRWYERTGVWGPEVMQSKLKTADRRIGSENILAVFFGPTPIMVGFDADAADSDATR